LNDAEQAGTEALTNLARQNEQIDNIVDNLDKMRTDIAYADTILQKIASPFAFMHLKKQGKEFQTVFGSPAAWSGPMDKKRDLMPGFKTRYFTLLHTQLMYFDGAQTIDSANFHDPRGTLDLPSSTIQDDRKKLEIILRNGKTKWHLRCADKNDFVGWLTMLERHKNKTFGANHSKPVEPAAPMASYFGGAQQPSNENPVADSKPKDVNALIDDNLDAMMAKLDNLGAMALEQKQAVDLQNEKLDIVENNMATTTNDMYLLKNKHKKRLKDN